MQVFFVQFFKAEVVIVYILHVQIFIQQNIQGAMKVCENYQKSRWGKS